MANRLNYLLSRRDLIKTVSASAVTVMVGGCQSLLHSGTPLEQESKVSSPFLNQYGPIDRTLSDESPRQFSGDNLVRAHQILWDAPHYLRCKSIEDAVEEVPLVIVGGGASGLFSAHCLKEFKPIVLEQAARFGGNAKGESWRGLDYSLGSAYIDGPRPGDAMHRYFQDLGWGDLVTARRGSDPVAYQGKMYPSFWKGETQPNEILKYARVNDFLGDLAAEKNGLVFPEIPTDDANALEAVRKYDRYSLHELMKLKAGGEIPRHLESAIEYYCWSTYAGSSKELSAAAAMNFLAQESSPLYAAAGGNARLLERLLERLSEEVPETNLRTGAVVVQVKVTPNGVDVLYEDSSAKLRKIRAKAVVMACPKFVVKKILADIEPRRLKRIERLKYRAYMVANVLLKKKPSQEFYDLFMVNDEGIDMDRIDLESEKKNATDFVVANFAAPDRDQGVLTLYRAFPYDDGRKRIYQPDAFDSYYSRFEIQIERDILPLLGMKSSMVEGLRLTRWGHALPLAQTGLYSDDTVSVLRKPHKERVFFVEQDNWAYPSFQTGATDAALMAPQIASLLKRGISAIS